MTDAEIRAALSDTSALIATLYGEARSEPIQGVIAVGCVIRNRVLADLGRDGKPDWWGESFREVCLKPWQFSCWYEDSPNRRKVYELAAALIRREPDGVETLLSELRWVAEGVIAQQLRDVTRGADHYLTAALFQQRPPAWAKGRTPVTRIGAHVFFRLAQ